MKHVASQIEADLNGTFVEALRYFLYLDRFASEDGSSQGDMNMRESEGLGDFDTTKGEFIIRIERFV